MFFAQYVNSSRTTDSSDFLPNPNCLRVESAKRLCCFQRFPLLAMTPDQKKSRDSKLLNYKKEGCVLGLYNHFSILIPNSFLKVKFEATKPRVFGQTRIIQLVLGKAKNLKSLNYQTLYLCWSLVPLPSLCALSICKGRSGRSARLSPCVTRASFRISNPFKTTIRSCPIRRLYTFPYLSANWQRIYQRRYTQGLRWKYELISKILRFTGTCVILSWALFWSIVNRLPIIGRPRGPGG